ncbi:putative toxin-antitoxin system toxin component, PIN family [Anaerophaga thermohalophila]|uniref:putative toxin-antitoxin system toxin component, PIN family n=1 Tax=Anaerophaga thermohalophila TaxID=177400 RepID=UPI000237D395|nr:putative toxin-antitoxin system toxin component, PIN family [Anaerophaga thermohalophila]
MRKESKTDKVIIDTNIWISFLIGKHLKGLHYIIASDVIKIITCKEQLAELYEVFQKPKIRKYFTTYQIHEFFDLLDDCSLLIEVESNVDICRDPKDNFLLALAKDANAHFIISGDNDLLTLESFALAKIISYKEFEAFFLT